MLSLPEGGTAKSILSFSWSRIARAFKRRQALVLMQFDGVHIDSVRSHEVIGRNYRNCWFDLNCITTQAFHPFKALC